MRAGVCVRHQRQRSICIICEATAEMKLDYSEHQILKSCHKYSIVNSLARSPFKRIFALPIAFAQRTTALMWCCREWFERWNLGSKTKMTAFLEQPRKEVVLCRMKYLLDMMACTLITASKCSFAYLRLIEVAWHFLIRTQLIVAVTVAEPLSNVTVSILLPVASFLMHTNTNTISVSPWRRHMACWATISKSWANNFYYDAKEGGWSACAKCNNPPNLNGACNSAWGQWCIDISKGRLSKAQHLQWEPYHLLLIKRSTLDDTWNQPSHRYTHQLLVVTTSWGILKIWKVLPFVTYTKSMEYCSLFSLPPCKQQIQGQGDWTQGERV